jgi:hypothetical protein
MAEDKKRQKAIKELEEVLAQLNWGEVSSVPKMKKNLGISLDKAIGYGMNFQHYFSQIHKKLEMRNPTKKDLVEATRLLINLYEIKEIYSEYPEIQSTFNKRLANLNRLLEY